MASQRDEPHGRRRQGTPAQRACAAKILEHLRAAGDRGATREELVRVTGTSEPTVRRATSWLRNHEDAPIEFDRATNRWYLRDLSFTIPVDAPLREDLGAAVVASAMLGAFADAELAGRMQRLVEQLHERVRSGEDVRRGMRPGHVVATMTTATPIDPGLLLTLIEACARKVVRIVYDSPWNDGGPVTYDVEPWQVRLHDGMAYLRAYSRKSGQPRCFRVVHIEQARILDGEVPRGRRPAADPWNDADPAFGVDYDRPGTARIRVRGPMARWFAKTILDPKQRDRWIEPGRVLERRVAYRSCREIARRLLMLGDALASVEPRELAEEIARHGRSLARVDAADVPGRGASSKGTDPGRSGASEDGRASS